MSKRSKARKPNAPTLVLFIGGFVAIMLAFFLLNRGLGDTGQGSQSSASVSQLTMGPDTLSATLVEEDGMARKVTESDMYINLMYIISQIKDTSVRHELAVLCETQLHLSREDPNKWLYVMPMGYAGEDTAHTDFFFGVQPNRPAQGDVTLWCDNSLLLRGEEYISEKPSRLMFCTSTLVHELVHVYDFREGRMPYSMVRDQRVANWTGSTAEQEDEQSHRVEMFATEFRAFDAQHRYIQEHYRDEWLEAMSEYEADSFRKEIYLTWERDINSDWRGMVYDLYEDRIFDPTDKYDPVAVRASVLSRIAQGENP